MPESAGNASLRSTSDPLDSDTHDWNADTGASAHMTPCHQWLHNYTPYRVPIRLADNTIIYSVGKGSVFFEPVIRGREAKAVEFTEVLHVPQLRNNLLAVLYLTRRCGYYTTINGTHMSFILNR